MDDELGVQEHVDGVGLQRCLGEGGATGELEEPLRAAVENTAERLNEYVTHRCGAFVVRRLPEGPHAWAGDVELHAEMDEESGLCDVRREEWIWI